MQNPLDISVASLPQNDNANATYAHTPSKSCKPKRIALSLATASIIASGALDISAAACQWSEDWSRGDANSHGVGRYARVDCSGTTTNLRTEFGNRTSGNYYRELRWYLSGTTNETNITATFNKNGSTWWTSNQMTTEVYFNGFNAPNTSFTFINANIGNAGISVTNSTLRSLTTQSGNFNRGLTVSGSNIGSLSVGGTLPHLIINGSSTIGNLTISGTISGGNTRQYIAQIGGGSLVTQLSVTGNVSGNLSVGERGVINSGFLTDFSGASGKFTTAGTNFIGVLSANLTIDGSAASWNNGTTAGQHILGGNNQIGLPLYDSEGNINGNIVINAGDNIEPNQVYLFENVVKNAANQTTLNNLDIRYFRPGTGLTLNEGTDSNGKKGFVVSADIASSYGANLMRALVLSSLRRTVNTQNILDTMTTKTFHSDRYYNQEVELRLLQYDMSRLTNRSSKFSKQTRKNQEKLDKVREKMAKLTLEQSKGQNLDKGYNNFEVIDQLDAIFIPYTGRRDWRFFAVPYATHSYVDLGSSQAQEYAGGALLGLQRNLRSSGIIGAFVGYEFVNTDTELTGGVDTRIQTNSLQAGLNYFKSFSITSKVWEAFIKGSVRAGIDMPNFTAKTGAFELKLTNNAKNVSMPLVYNLGAEVKGGLTFYQFKRNSYVAPEVSLSYDMMASTKSIITKPIVNFGTTATSYRPLGADEKYNDVYWHLPQLGVHVRYYKMFGNKFRTNLKAGIKYNMLNKQKAYIQIGNLKDNSTITLPAVYGNLGFDLIWMIKKNHELSFGYDGLFYASTFAKERNNQGQNVKTNDWFNGVTTNLNFKYAYWFGGTDYVTDKDGNAVSRSIAEGKKSKKGKKSKSKKKSKKSKKKVYYIDG